jgi:hypothetical protein
MAKNRIGAQLAPVVTDMAGRLSTWIAENDDFIEQDLPTIIEGIVDVAANLLPIIVDLAKETAFLVKEFKGANDEGSGLKDTIAALGVVYDTVTEPIRQVGALLERQVQWILDAAEALGIFDEQVKAIKAGLGVDDTPRQDVRGLGAGLVSTDQAGARARAGGSRVGVAANVQSGRAQRITGEIAKRAAQDAIAPSLALIADANAGMAALRSGDLVLDEDGKPKRRTKPKGGGKGKAKAEGGDSFLDDLLGPSTGAVKAGGGTSALSGARFVTIDNSFTFNVGGVEVAVRNPGASAQQIAERVNEIVEGKMREAARRRADAFQRPAEVG